MRQMIRLFCTLAISFSGCKASAETSLLLENLPEGKEAELEALRDSLGGNAIRQLGIGEIWTVPTSRETELLAELERIDEFHDLSATRLERDYREIFTTPTHELSEAQLEMLDAVREGRPQGSVSVVELSPAPLVNFALTSGFDTRDGFNEQGSLRINLGDRNTVTAVRVDAPEVTENGYVWRGRIEDTGGDVMLVSRGDEMAGTVTLEGKIFSIRPLGNGLHTVVEKQVKNLPAEHPPRFLEEMKKDRPARDFPPPKPVSFDEQITIDVLVAYTPAVSKKYKDVEQDLLRVAFEETRLSLKDSKLPHLRFNLVHAYEIAYKEASLWDDHIEKFAGTTDGTMDGVHSVRKKHKADIAVLVIDDNDYCGEAKEIHASASTAFAVVHHDCATGYYSFGHELAHLFGARHDTCVDPKDVPYKHGHGFLNGNKWRTIMGYGNCCNSCARQRCWSNPDLTWKGVKTGSKEKENNVKVLRDEAKRIAAFM